MTAAVREAMGNFPEKILPDGESGQFFRAQNSAGPPQEIVLAGGSR